MERWLQRTQQFLRGHGEAVLVTQLSVEGSAPREAGVKMLISRHAIEGTIGGGNLEYIAIDQARKLLDESSLGYVIQDYPLGPLLAQCCGGHVRLLFETLGQADLKWLQQADRQMTETGVAWLQTSFEGGYTRKTVSHRSHLPRPASGHPIYSLAKSGAILTGARPTPPGIAFICERIEGRAPVLFVFGAGHVGRAVINVLAPSMFDITWLDSRPSLAGGEVGDVEIQHLDDSDQTIHEAPSGAYFLIFTHSHDEDYSLLETILRRGDAHYCGLIGSATKRARFLKRLEKSGLPRELLAPFVCPIGLTDLKSKDPAVIAVGVAAQLFCLVENKATQITSMELEKR